MSAPSIGSIIALFERWGRETYDEEISQVDHALQTAALATAAGAGDQLIAAALLHDIGHLLDLEAGRTARERDLRHEHAGAAWLRPLFPPAVTAPIALHVRAKRFLCATEPAYATGLSAGSVHSLERQGGPMSAAGTESFGRLAGSGDAVRLRRWDDAGKVDGLPVAPLSGYTDLLSRVAWRVGPVRPG